MTMNWLIDRLLVLGIVLVVAGAVAALSAAGFGRVGETCGLAALVASLVTVWLRR
ncbi:MULTISPECIES: hypothetical protein [Methylobacteriaceae]|jgi:hypothetical protein|uniref:Uncharacterized protein n=2 Tax=Methylobacteriaceae TaxID=119045 RepID=A0ABU9ZKE0_9HYPH|nr:MULTISPECIES: hypothetical protein [Methylobacteriaceae]MBE7201340.1 hypothetical protein [Parafilimonas terrae]MBY0143898.1 hypothetical protein [Methylorubrum populi]MCX7329919.1 hypothetical protein [Hyphomicrobiales bacterium]MBB5760879.1 hypothetical protein [Methylorubrum rhodesianum]MBK3402294.1 hypothetical protein [Methylorubrum rhodesianum]